jgi:hypothetical protein
MATGLLTTCKQVYHEASNMFWSKNTFRFSGDIYWFGARRFLGQIGPRAISQLQALELFVPVVDVVWGDPNGGEAEFLMHARTAKNRPKMHMVKARADLWTRKTRREGAGRPVRQFPRWYYWEDRFEFERPKSASKANLEHVYYLLEMAKSSLELSFILPGDFGFDHPRPWRWSRPVTPTPQLYILRELLDIVLRSIRRVILVIEPGAAFESFEMAEQFTDKGIDILCQPGSTFIYDPTQPVLETSETKIWRNPYLEFDYLDGVPALFDEEKGSSLPALGGRATSTPGLRSTERVLKGFGGCRFIYNHEGSGYRAAGCCCRWKNGYWRRPVRMRVRRVVVNT